MNRDKIINDLKIWGCDTENALDRLDGDKDLFVECARIFCDDENFTQLFDALEAGDIKRAFNCAHTLKGVAVNFGFIPLFNSVSEIVEPLRDERLSLAVINYKKLIDVKSQYDAIVISNE